MIFSQRSSCIFCKGTRLQRLLDKNRTIPLGNFVVDSPTAASHWMPYNLQYCETCGTVQNEYVGDLSLIYENNFAGAFGSIRSTHNTLFGEFILANPYVQAICEIGAGNGSLSDFILETKALPYTIIDPSFGGNRTGKQVVSKFLEQCDTVDLSANTIVMSHVFEHFYNPVEILEKLQSTESIQHIYLSFPDLEDFIQQGTYHVLNSEHTYYVTNQFIQDIFAHYGFVCQRTYSHQHHSVFFEFKRQPLSEGHVISFPRNVNTDKQALQFVDRLLHNIQSIVWDDTPTYIWPCSMHTLYALSMGLPSDRINAVLDNSPLKIGHYLYGFGKKCLPFTSLVESPELKCILLAGGCYNQEIIEIIKSYPQNTYHIL